MTEPLYWVVVKATKKRRRRRRLSSVVKRMGPMSHAKAQEVKDASIVNRYYHQSCSIRVEADRTGYWASYHKKRYASDEEYRTRKQDCARAWQRRAKAAARGDMTPWLTQE